MNQISEVGLFRRELRDVRTVAANIDHRTRQVLDPPLERPAE